MNQVTLHNVSIALENTPIVSHVSFSLEEGQIGCLLGPSGCGKTTLLRAIAGFEQPSHGHIKIADQTVASSDYMLPPEQRKIGMVFQDLALFPHLSIADNIAFGMRNASANEVDQRITELLKLVELEHLRNQYPHQLSGGQQQRVALIRAMAPCPKLLLLDEPFSSQDTERRVHLAHEVRDLLHKDGITGLMVTHDQHEAFAIADAVGVIEKGQLRQWGSPYALYHEPADRFVADFIGEGVLICGSVSGDRQLQTELGIIEGDLEPPITTGTQVELLVRPDDIVHDDHSPYQGVVLEKAFRGAHYLYTLLLPGSTRVLCLAPSHHNHDIGEKIGVRLEIDHMIAFPT